MVDTVMLETELRKLRDVLSKVSGVMERSSGNDGSNGMNGPRPRAGGNGGRVDDNKETRKALEKFREKLIATGDETSIAMANSMRTVTDMNNIMSTSIEEKLSEMAELYAKVSTSKITVQEYDKAMQVLTGTTQKAGETIEEFMERTKKTQEDMTEVQERGIKAHRRANLSVSEFASEIMRTSKIIAVAGYAFDEAFSIAEASASRGAEITLDQAITARKLGISQATLMNITADYSQTMRAASMSTDEATAMMDRASLKLLGVTGSLEKGAKFAMDSAEMFKLAGGVDDTQLNGFVDNMGSAFANLQQSLGTTAEQFFEMNKALIANVDVQGSMFKMTKAQQLVYLQEAQVRRQLLVDAGLRADQADTIITSMAQLQGKTAKDRMKDAAKIQASLGAMGMGTEGQRAAELIRKGRLNSDEQLELDKIMKDANFMAAENGQGSIQSEMVQDMLNSMNPLMGPDSPIAAAVTQAANALAEDAPQEKEPPWWREFVLRTGNILNGLKSDNLVKIAGLGIATIAGGILIQSVVKMFSSVGGALGSVFSTVGRVTGVLSRFAGGIGMMAGAFKIGWEIGTKLNDFINEFMPNLGNLIGKVLYNIVEFVKDIPNKIMRAFDSFGTWLSTFFENLIPQWMRDVAGGTTGLVSKLDDKIGNWFGGDEPIEIKPSQSDAHLKVIADSVAAVAEVPKSAEEVAKEKEAREIMYNKIGEGLNNLSDKMEKLVKTSKDNVEIAKEQKTVQENSLEAIEAGNNQPMKIMN